jgi:hypothetical protein
MQLHVEVVLDSESKEVAGDNKKDGSAAQSIQFREAALAMFAFHLVVILRALSTTS